jgi:PilZ domain-containing protein
MAQERRAFLRVETELTVWCSPIGDDGERGDAVSATALNISAGGALTTHPLAGDPFQLGQRHWLEVRFRTPRFLVFTEARVLRAGGEHAAFQFDELEEYTQQRVVRWVYGQDRRLFERRAQARIPVTARATCRRIAPTGEAVEEFAAPTVDVALEAVRIRSERLLDIGAAIDLTVDFEDGLPPFAAAAAVADATQAGERFEYLLRLERVGPVQRRGLIERALAAERRIGS